MDLHVVILGAGPGGYTAALRAAQLGAKVTLIEQEQPGGVCLNWGCIPTKTLLAGCDILRKVQHPERYGLEIDGLIRPALDKMMARKNQVVADQIKGLHHLFAQNQITYIQGTGTITGPKSLSVQGPEVGSETIHWDRLILATGSVPKQLKGFPWDGQKILNSNQALELESIPESLLIVGGGVIGCEFACLFSALGTQVVLVEALERLLPVPGIDEECSSLLLREMKKLTTKCYCNTSVNTWKDQGAHLEVELGPSPFTNDQSKTKDFSKSIVAEKILLCLGRSSQSHTLGLETIGIGTDDTGWVETDATLATTSKGVYAIGDLLGPSRMMLAHAAATEGRVAAENALGGSKTMDYRSIPSAIFTTPEVANTGLTEKQALDLGYQVDTSKVLFRTLGKAHAEAEIAGQGKIVSDQSTGKLLGAHLIGPRVTEYIGEMVLALNKGCTVNDLAEVVHPHPTFSEILGDLALKLVNT